MYRYIAAVVIAVLCACVVLPVKGSQLSYYNLIGTNYTGVVESSEITISGGVLTVNYDSDFQINAVSGVIWANFGFNLEEDEYNDDVCNYHVYIRDSTHNLLVLEVEHPPYRMTNGVIVIPLDHGWFKMFGLDVIWSQIDLNLR